MALRREQFINNSSTTLNEALDNSETVITVTDGSVFPADGDFPVIVEDEVMHCTSRSADDLTVVRGVDGSAAVSHDTALTIKALLTASNIQDFVDQAAGVGSLSAVVGGSSNRLPYRLLDDSNTVLTASDFTWNNQGSSTVADDPFGGLTITDPNTASAWRLLYKTPPTAPYKFTVNIMFGPGATYGNSGTLQGAGWRESDTGRLVSGILEPGQDHTGGFDGMGMWRLTSTAFNAFTATQNEVGLEWDEIWMELEDDNTNLIFRASLDGINWHLVGQDLRTTWLTSNGPDQIMWVFNSRSSADNLLHLRAWIEE